MQSHLLDVIIVGGGHAGLSASYYLKQYGLEHLVLERGKVGESWRSQRWDSFKLNTPNRLNTLPGDIYKGNDPEGFCSAGEFVSSFENYVSSFQLPVLEDVTVISIEKGNAIFTITVSQNNIIRQYECRQVIVASGCANEKIIPAFNISKDIKQLHTSEYRNSRELPDGATLVVGGAQSGIQIAEDLADAGRKVYFSTSMVARVPRRYRGRDIHDWLIDMKFFDAKKEQVSDPAMLKMKPPHLTGVGNKVRTISLQSLAKKGVTLLGKMESANNQNVFFQSNAAMHVKFADGFSAKVKGMIDEFIEKTRLTTPPAEMDDDDLPDISTDSASDITLLNLEEHGIRSIIWTTGFSGNFNYLKLPVLDNEGYPIHRNGLADEEGLYFLGLPWLRSRKSTILFGLKDDAEFITGKVFIYARDKKGLYATTS